MQKGKIVEEVTADEIIENPVHPYTQRLLADVPTIHKEWLPNSPPK